MERKIYIIDFIGVHCGMHYYLEAFKKCLAEIPNVEIEIVSNYSETHGSEPVLLNQYKGNKIKKISCFFINLWRIHRLVKKNTDAIFIYLSYGTILDIQALKIVSKAKNHIIDIHEAIAQNLDSNKSISCRLSSIYKSKIHSVISHSERTDTYLASFGYEGERMYVPHFKYQYSKEYDEDSLSSEVTNVIFKNMVNILFFGNINESKGIDILMSAVNLIDDKIAQRVNFIIAGKDFDGVWRTIKIKKNRNIHYIIRHITDNELNYLYTNVDYIAMPYRKTSQSGIIETAFYFKKPIIATDIPYFHFVLDKFKSFGLLVGNPTPEDYSKGIEKAVEMYDRHSFYVEDDYYMYEHRQEVDQFRLDFIKWLNKLM